MSEIPLIFPSQGAASLRYIVNDSKRTVSRRPQPLEETEHTEEAEYGVAGDAAPGGASASSLKLPSGHTALLSTSPIAANPKVLAVALSSSDIESPLTIELDLASETSYFSNPIKVQAFLQDGDRIRLILLDEIGHIVMIMLKLESLAPEVEPFEFLSICSLLSQPLQNAVTGSRLQSTMVAFYSDRMMVVALAPLLLSINLHTRSCSMWSEKHCLEEMRSKNSAIGSLFTKATDLIRGKLDERQVDMAPVGAICVSSAPNPLLDPTFVFTLHSDGRVRRWTVSGDYETPLEVALIEVRGIPSPRNWNDSHNSVFMCARLYQHVYTLAVHIRIDGIVEKGKSVCELFVVHGAQNTVIQPIVMSSLCLVVPSEAHSLVGMDFVPGYSNCSLTALFQSMDSNTMFVNYAPSVVSIVTTRPTVAPITHNLDGVALAELNRIKSLSFMESLSGSAKIEDELHELDTYFLKYLFRPNFPRGVGTTTPPSSVHISAALRKVLDYRGYGELLENMSIQLETVRVIQLWRAHDNRKRASLVPYRRNVDMVSKSASEKETAPSTEAALSVYESFVTMQNDETEEMETNDPSDQIERERDLELEAHERRWRRLLLQIWEDESLLRIPLYAKLVRTGQESAVVIVRTGFTSLTVGTAPSQDTDVWTMLDDASLKLIEIVEEHEFHSTRISRVEHSLMTMIANADLDIDPSNFEDEVSAVGTIAYEDSNSFLSEEELKRLRVALNGISSTDMMAFLEEVPRNSHIPEVSHIIQSNVLEEHEGQVETGQIPNNQLRQAACSLALRAVNSARRLLLGRYLLLSYLVENQDNFQIAKAAFCMYWRSLAALWVASQHVKMPVTAFQTQSRGYLSVDKMTPSPPSKRVSYGDGASSILAYCGVHDLTTSIDELLIYLLQTKYNAACQDECLVGIVSALGKELFQSLLASIQLGQVDMSSDKLCERLPELRALRQPSSDSVAIKHPRLALRLLAPVVAFLPPSEPANVRTIRRELLAECLLVESHMCLPTIKKSMMLIKACDLLSTKIMSRNEDPGRLERAYHRLQAKTERLSQVAAFRFSLEVMAQNLQIILYGEEACIRRGVRRLCALETAQKLFAPLCGLDEDKNETLDDVQTLVPRLLQVSNLVHRVDIVEHHVGRNTKSSHLLLDFICNTIREVEELFPPNTGYASPELCSLYSRLFHNAISAGAWKQAFDACLSNPSSDRKISNFKRLVSAMVDAGALEELLDKCSTIISAKGSPSEYVDLYNIAAEALSEACFRDFYLIRARVSEAAKISDYQGALYALHVSQGQWRRAAQSLDLRFINALRALESNPANESWEVLTQRDSLIAEDLVLASVGAANAICLVEDSSHRFIISGEYGQHHFFPESVAQVSFDDGARTKRNREASGSDESIIDLYREDLSSRDRISQFMTYSDLENRTIWSMVFRTVFCDGKIEPSYAKHTFLGDKFAPYVDNTVIHEVVSNGYLIQGLLLARSIGKSKEGRLFHDSLLSQLGNLVPLTTDGSISHNCRRPSFVQLSQTLDGIGVAGWNSECILGTRSKGVQSLQLSVRKTMTMRIVERLTTVFSSADNCVALESAKLFLDYDSGIPKWLHNLLVKGTSEDWDSSDGLFARRGKGSAVAYMGDPSALLTLYTRRGMYLEACEVVAAVLLDSVKEHEQKASHRLPEKGDVDFIPYKKIDILWNLIDIALSRELKTSRDAALLKKAQERVILALEKHYSLLETSEMGLRSARALALQESSKQPIPMFE